MSHRNGIGRTINKGPLELDLMMPLDVLTDHFALLTYLAEAKTLDQFFKRITSILRRLGLTSFAYARLQKTRDVAASVGNVIPEAQKLYQKYDFGRFDMSVEHVLLDDSPVLMSQIKATIGATTFKSTKIEQNAELLKMMATYGYHNYWNNGFDSYSGDGRALIIFGAGGLPSDEFDRRVTKHVFFLLTLSKAVDQVGWQKFPHVFSRIGWSGPVDLGPKPLKLLHVIGRNKVSLKDAAKLCCISDSTANQHIAAAKQALGVNSITAAVLEAARLGLIDVDVRVLGLDLK